MAAGNNGTRIEALHLSICISIVILFQGWQGSFNSLYWHIHEPICTSLFTLQAT